MSRELILEVDATHQATALLADDPEGLRQLLKELDRLPEDPRPPGSFPYGSPDLRRLRVGRYRVLSRITDEQILVGHIGRTAGSGRQE